MGLVCEAVPGEGLKGDLWAAFQDEQETTREGVRDRHWEGRARQGPAPENAAW